MPTCVCPQLLLVLHVMLWHMRLLLHVFTALLYLACGCMRDCAIEILLACLGVIRLRCSRQASVVASVCPCPGCCACLQEQR
jgi:hypothetical protein